MANGISTTRKPLCMHQNPASVVTFLPAVGVASSWRLAAQVRLTKRVGYGPRSRSRVIGNFMASEVRNTPTFLIHFQYAHPTYHQRTQRAHTDVNFPSREPGESSRTYG